jgi:hypothetical protein
MGADYHVSLEREGRLRVRADITGSKADVLRAPDKTVFLQ